jgi:peptidoglycan/xylan/chitin deacetylase (PgdA/CDA1 family)
MAGKFIISLDFELFWGVRDKKSLEEYSMNILGVWEVLPIMINLFEKYNVKATFATVGFLFLVSKEELIKLIPKRYPHYLDSNLSPYNGHFDLISEFNSKLHFAPELIALIKKYPTQEIATHTFSHYYCLEPGQSKEEFEHDIVAAVETAKRDSIDIKSLVFPRNQFNDEYLEVIKSLGITSFRGNERSWIYEAVNGRDEKLLRRAVRLLDAYVNISGHNCYSLGDLCRKEPFDIPSSRFLRPYSSSLRSLEWLRLRRILNSMTYAAKEGKLFHLWWHPHNFGINQNENIGFLNKILEKYIELNQKYGFESVTMKEMSSILYKMRGNE